MMFTIDDMDGMYVTVQSMVLSTGPQGWLFRQNVELCMDARLGMQR